MSLSTLVVCVWSLVALSSADHFDSVNGVKVGDLRTLAHGVRGQVYAWNESTLVLKEFEYDGAGPDAFFWVGTEKEPSTVGTILPYPFEGKFYEYEDTDAPILEGAFNKERVVLTLPKNLKVTELRWLSVWCRAFKVNFGDVFFPDNLTFDHEESNDHADPEAEHADPEAEHADPEAEQADPEAEHDHDDHHHHHHHDAEGEPEGHPEDEANLPPPLVSVDSNSVEESRAEAAAAEAESEAEAEAAASSLLLSNLFVFVLPLLLLSNVLIINTH